LVIPRNAISGSPARWVDRLVLLPFLQPIPEIGAIVEVQGEAYILQLENNVT
jgi:hypothetical protein